MPPVGGYISRIDREELETMLRARADELAAATVGELAGDGALDAATARNLRVGIAQAIARFCDRLRNADVEVDTEVFEHHGRLQFAAGGTLEEMLRYYMVGSQVVRRRAEELADTSGVAPTEVIALGDELIRVLNDLLQAAAIGYSAEWAEMTRRRRVALDALWTVLTADPPSPVAAVSAAAEAAQWPLPARIRAVVARLPGLAAAPVRKRLPGDVLCSSVGERLVAMLAPDGPQADELTRRATRALDLVGPIVVGLSVPPADAARSIKAAAALLAAHTPARAVPVPGGEGSAGAPVSAAAWIRCEDHLLATLLACERDLAARLADERLRPLDALEPRTRGRLEETLQAWLDHPRQPLAMASVLGLHVQTVRYRLRRLRGVFGDGLDDPAVRLELAIALRARAVLRPRE